MLKIVILTDSLGRPRPDIDEKEKTEYEEVYGYQLKNYFRDRAEVELLYIESLDTSDAVHWSQRMVAFRKPDLVIYQIGINDAAPRIFKKGSRPFFFNPLFQKITRNIIGRLISRYRIQITKFLKRTYTSPENFRKNWFYMTDEVKKFNPDCDFFCISIAYPSKRNNERSYGYKENVIQYNSVLKEVFKEGYLELNEIGEEENRLISDGIHLTRESHRLLFEQLKNKISLWMKQKSDLKE